MYFKVMRRTEIQTMVEISPVTGKMNEVLTIPVLGDNHLQNVFTYLSSHHLVAKHRFGMPSILVKVGHDGQTRILSENEVYKKIHLNVNKDILHLIPILF